MVTIGQQLKHARNERGLSIEDVAFHTRIPAARVRDMENGDLSRFANLTYARGFMKIYGEYLALDLSEYLGQFHTEEFAHASGHEYVQTANATQNLPAAVFTDHGRSKSPGIFILLGALAVAGGIIWWNNRDTGEAGPSAPATQASVKSSPAAGELSGSAARAATDSAAAPSPQTPEPAPIPTPAASAPEVAASSPALEPSALPDSASGTAANTASKVPPPKAKVIEEQEP